MWSGALIELYVRNSFFTKNLAERALIEDLYSELMIIF